MSRDEGAWLKNSSFDPSLLVKTSAPVRNDEYRANLLAQAESSSAEDDFSEGRFQAAKQETSRKRGHDGESKTAKRRKKEHRKQRKKDKDNDPGRQIPFHWAEDALGSSRGRDWNLDIQKQKDNLVYQKTYVYDKPAFRRYIPQPIKMFKILAEDNLQSDPKRKKRKRFTTRISKVKESDVNRVKWSIDFNEKTCKTNHNGNLKLPLPSFIPIEDELAGYNLSGQRESAFEAMRRRTISYNKISVERPEDLQNWLDFAEFQDEFHRFMNAQKEGNLGRAERSVAEKQVDILQHALKYHPESSEIICRLCQATQKFEDLDQTKARFEDLLRDSVYSRSPQLWREYITFLKHKLLSSNRGLTSVSEILQAYNRALKALVRERLRLLTEHDLKNAQALEDSLNLLLLDSIRMCMQAGHIELAISKIQAVIEFLILGPNWSTAVPGPGGDSVRKPLFEEYWNSEAALIGEEGCQGWQNWALNHQNPNIPPPPDPVDLDPGGWSGWQELEIHDQIPESDPMTQRNEDYPSDDEKDASPELDEENEEQQLSRLLEEEAQSLQAGANLPHEVIQTWLQLERQRERCDWQPERNKVSLKEKESNDSNKEEVSEDEGDHKLIHYSDVEACLFSQLSEENMVAIVEGLLGILDIPVENPLSSISPLLSNEYNNRDSPWPELVAMIMNKKGGENLAIHENSAWTSPQYLAEKYFNPLLAKQGYILWYQEDETRHIFVRRLLEMLITTGRLSMKDGLCEALVKVTTSEFLSHPTRDELTENLDYGIGDLGVFEDKGNSDQKPIPKIEIRRVEDIGEALGPILKIQSEGSTMWTAYATHEMIYGSVKRARRTFDFYLRNLSSKDPNKITLAPLVLKYAESVIARKTKGSQNLAMYLLVWLATGPHKYEPPSENLTIPPQRIANARQAFHTEIPKFLSRNRLSSEEGKYLTCAALLEDLVEGSESALNGSRLLKNILQGYPKEVKQSSSILEELTLKVCTGFVQKIQNNVVSAKEARSIVLESLEVYPQSYPLINLLTEIDNRSYLMTKLRIHLRSVCEEQHSVPLWIIISSLENSIAPAKTQRLFKFIGKFDEAQNSPLWQRACFGHSLSFGQENLDIMFASMTDNCPWAKDVWLDGLRFEGNHRYRISEAERRDIQIRTSIEEVIYTLAGQRLDQKGL